MSTNAEQLGNTTSAPTSGELNVTLSSEKMTSTTLQPCMNESMLSNRSDLCMGTVDKVNLFEWRVPSIIGISIGICVLTLVLGILGMLLYKRRENIRRTRQANAFASSSYISGSLNTERGHCNLTVATECTDIDDLTSLDNDSFLHSLESSIFTNYMIHARSARLSNDSGIGGSNTTIPNQHRHPPRTNAPPRPPLPPSLSQQPPTVAMTTSKSQPQRKHRHHRPPNTLQPIQQDLEFKTTNKTTGHELSRTLSQTNCGLHL